MLNPFSSPVFSSFRPHLLLFYSYTLCVVLLFCGEEMLVGKKRRAVVKCGWEERMTTAIDLKSPLEYFFWASLSYEPLSYEPNISVWVSFWYMVQQCRISTAVLISTAVKNISCSSEEYIMHLCSHTLAPGLKKVKEYGNILSVGMRHLSQRIQSWLKGWITPPSGRVVALK